MTPVQILFLNRHVSLFPHSSGNLSLALCWCAFVSAILASSVEPDGRGVAEIKRAGRIRALWSGQYPPQNTHTCHAGFQALPKTLERVFDDVVLASAILRARGPPAGWCG